MFGCLVAIVAIVANAITATLKANAETNLKRRMVEQGYPADDIMRVIRATRAEGIDANDLPLPNVPSKPPRQYKPVV